jgi:hypothetical protein
MKSIIFLLSIKCSSAPTETDVACLDVGVAASSTNDNNLLDCHITSAVT